jgi:hypothetical protein
MAATPNYIVNSPTSGTQYYSPMWCGVVSSGESLTVNATCYTGANGTGSQVSVSSLQLFLWDQTDNVNGGSVTENSVSSWNFTHSSTSGKWYKCSVNATFTGSVGSIVMSMSYTTSTAFVPTTPSFSPSSGGIGDSITLTGSRFTDATFVEFDGVASGSVTINSDTSITATVPSGAGTGVVTVGNPAGSANSSGNFATVVMWVNTGTSGSPVWTAAHIYVNTGTSGSPVWTEATEAAVNTGTSGSPVWTGGQ